MMPNRNILLVEDNHKERVALCETLESWGYHVTTAHDGPDAAKKIKTNTFRLVISSYETPGLSGAELFNTIRSENEDTQVLFLSSRASVENAVEIMKAGALDFILRPADYAQIKHLVRMTFDENGDRSPSQRSKGACLKIVTQDQSMQRLLDLAIQVAESKASVLIQGESGTGKELFARFIHENSKRRNSPFVAVNCGALPESLLESELFGHEKGAFTGAVCRKLGKFELADGGTILLDEITEMQFHLQAKLLRVLQEREIDRVGGIRPIGIDVRVIATTNKDIKALIEKGGFRRDLFYRLNVIPLKILPLRERHNDIPLLAQHFIEKYNEIDGRNVKGLTKEAVHKICRFSFNGNVRELENIIERAVLLCDGQWIHAENILSEETLYDSGDSAGEELEFSDELMAGPLRAVEKKIIFHTLDKTNGNRTHAAKILGISVRTLRNKLNEYKEKMEGA